ncbi:MAG: type II toxin-antitoxin system HicB family antitoxin [Nostocaceae cyanobacterium]|nr:type II toxin-antitoxin system HicB family antitoxin [Nostocaceae cyanobacterium]
MDFYRVILRQSTGYWVALCLENGIVGQGNTQEDAISKLKDAIESFQSVYETEDNIYSAPLCVKELQEFLMVSGSSDN